MKISEMLKKAHIIDALTSTTKRDTLAELSNVILRDKPSYDSEKVVKIL